MVKCYILLIYYIDDEAGLKELIAMHNNLVKVIVVLTLEDVISLKNKYPQDVIEALPIQMAVGIHTCLISESVREKMFKILQS